MSAITNNGKSILINGTSYTGYSSYDVVNTRTKVTEPQRTITGAIPNLSSIDEFIATTIYVTFKFLDIAVYRDIIAKTSQAEFDVTYFDIDTGEEKTGKFYLAPATKKELFWKGGVAIAVVSFTLEMISTNNTDE